MINLISIIISAIALIVAITIHEFSHALTADRLGDPTPRSQGRLSLNPLKHLDPLGTLLLIFVHFGWGKPVQVDAFNFKHPKRDELFVSLAGPASNLILSGLLSLVLRFAPLSDLALYLITVTIQYNVILAIFNLIPVPPLDGSKIFLNLLPSDKSFEWEESLIKYGPILLIVLVFLPFPGNKTLIDLIMSPVLNFIFGILIP